MTETRTGTGLAERLHGPAVMAADADWDMARQAYNLTVDQRPEVVAFPSDADDVARAVRFARDEGMQVAAQRTGHGAAAMGSLEGTLLLNTRGLGGVEIDADARTARVGAGVRWLDLVPQASDMGLAALHGSAPDICVVGYSLGGGLGFYARKLGLAANSIAAIELVNAEGEQIRVDADNEPELYWAMRGGGGNFGIVTALELELTPLEAVYAGALFFDYARSSEVLRAWREWIEDKPEELLSIGRMLKFPPLPEVPEPMRGNSFGVIEAVYMGDEAEGAELIKPLRDLGPAMDTFAAVPPAGILELHMDPPEPVPYNGEHLLLNDLPLEGIDAFVEAGGPDSDIPLVSMELRQLGGALRRRGPGAGALASIDADFLYFGVGMVPGAEAAPAVRAAQARMIDAVKPWDAGCAYANFNEKHGDSSACWDAETFARLQRAKAAYDPDGILRANHAIVPTS